MFVCDLIDSLLYSNDERIIDTAATANVVVDDDDDDVDVGKR